MEEVQNGIGLLYGDDDEEDVDLQISIVICEIQCYLYDYLIFQYCVVCDGIVRDLG